MPLKMQRGRTQSLFRYLPDQTYNWQGRAGSFKGTTDVDAREMDVPRAWIKRNLRRLIRPFVESARLDGINFPGDVLIEREEFELLEPKKFRGELFPRTWVCLSCDRFINDSLSSAPQCRCGQNLVQLSFVEYHKCGYLSGLVPPSCPNNCRAGMKLVNRTSRTLTEWEWRCARCNSRADRGLNRGCPNCRSGQIKVLRADASPVFYPQYIKVVNPPSRADYTLLDTDAVYSAAVAQALGVLPPGFDGLRQGVNNRGTENAMAEARRQLIEDFGLQESDPVFELMLERARSQSSAQSDWTGSVDALGLDPEALTELGYQCVELTIARAASPLTIDDLVAQAPTPALRALYDGDYRTTLTRYGFAEAVLLREFPLAFVVAGYTREARENAQGVRFNFFRGAGSSVPMFGQRSETEALLFRLDPAKVLDWLVSSGILEEAGPGDPQARLFSLMQPITSIFEEPSDRITSAVLGLVHSAAHRTLKAVAVRSGLSTESLSEYLMPHNLAFLIFADTRGESVLGGLEHVFRNYLSSSLESLDQDRRCVFDPPCRERRGGGACAVCMYLSETSCERFNTSLSRWYLFGGDDGSIRWQGYWNP
jgi:hypothetical protein